MPQLEHVHTVRQALDRCGVRAAELFIGVCLGGKVGELLCGKVGQELAQNVRGTSLVVLAQKRLHLVRGQRRELGRAEQSAARCDTGCNGLCRAHAQLLVSAAYIVHIFETSMFGFYAPSIRVKNVTALP